MQHSKHPVDQVIRDIETSSKSSPTAAGQAESATATEANNRLVDTINQVFALFRINYHNQFYSAFSDTTLLDQAKRLWFDVLGNFEPEAILAAARNVIEQNEYLPTLNAMLEACDQQLSAMGLPTARKAYTEACNAPSPKIAQQWSHPAVYHAGLAYGWYQLAHQTEAVSWPEFKKQYRIICQRVLGGENLAIDAPPALDKPAQPSLSREEKHQRMNGLRKEIGL